MDSKLGDIPKKDPKKLILDEFRSGKRIFESYNNFCKKMGSNFLDYPEFEFWFQRFSSGNFDLDYDRSQDPKYRTIEDIPVDIFEKICGNLKDDEKNNYWFTLRHVCKSFRAIVDSWTPPKFNNIEIYSYREQLISLRFNGFDISYVEKSEHLSEIGFSYHPNSLQSGNYRDLAIDDLTKILDVPGGCKLEKLKITEEIDNHFAQKLFEKIENCSKIHVGIVYLHIFRMEMIPVINILNLCQSIKEIDIQTSDLPNEEFTDKLKEITSLKNVEMVKIHNTSRDGEFWDPSSLNVPIITVVLTKTTVYKFIRLLKALLKSPHLKYCRVIAFVGKTEAFEDGLYKLGVRNDSADPDSDNYKYPIPDSDEFFEIHFSRKWGFHGGRTTFTGADIIRKSNSA